MAEEENTPDSSTDEKPFFAIDAEDVAEAAAATSLAATIGSAPSTTVQPPQPVMLGTLSGVSGASEFTPTSGAEGEIKANPWGAPAPQLTGDINTMGEQGMFTIPATLPQEQERFNWGQYGIGFVIPIIAVFLLGVVGEVLSGSDDYENPWRYEEISMQSGDNQTFEIQFAMNEDEVMEGFYSYFETEDGHAIHISFYYDNYVSSPDTTVYQYNDTSAKETAIGTYYDSNSTAYFQLSDATADELWLSVDFYNPELDEYDSFDAFNIFLCFMPFIYLASVIAAFVKGKKALAYGLLTPFFLWIGLIIAFILMLIAFW